MQATEQTDAGEATTEENVPVTTSDEPEALEPVGAPPAFSYIATSEGLAVVDAQNLSLIHI